MLKPTYAEMLIPAEMPARQAMNRLDATGWQILFVVNTDGALYGSLTDGDIRRWILNGGSLDASAGEMSYKTPYVVFDGFNRVEARAVVAEENYICVPVLDRQRRVVDLVFRHELLEGGSLKQADRRLEIPVVIMAGGKGTRLDPFTKILPKPLIPIGDKSILEVIIDKFLVYGLDHFYMTVNHKARIIKSYFEEIEAPYTITYIDEEMPLGTAGSLTGLQGLIDGPFLVTNCDIIIDANYPDILDYHRNTGNLITLVASLKHYKIPYGVCEIENGGDLQRINEKPEFSYLVNAGMYIVESSTLSLIPPNELFHITHLIEKVKEQGGRIGVFPISEDAWIDTGEWGEYKKAIARLAEMGGC